MVVRTSGGVSRWCACERVPPAVPTFALRSRQATSLVAEGV